MIKSKSLLLALCFLLTACSPITRASGEITDALGTPLANVKVSIIGKSLAPNAKLEYITQPDGKYNFNEFYVSAQEPVEIKLKAEKEGYKPFLKDLKFNDDNVDKIVLEKSGS